MFPRQCIIAASSNFIEFGGPPPGLSKGPGPGSDEGDLVVPHGPPGGFDGPPPAGLHFSKDEPGAERGPFDETMEPPPPDMTNSMTNNIGAMDKANIQGDSDVGKCSIVFILYFLN